MNRKNIEDILLQMGVPANINGFRYIVDAILFMNDEGTWNLKYTYLYYLVAKKYHTSIECVERAMRHAFETARKTENARAMVEHYIGYAHRSNSASLKMLYIRLKDDEEEGTDTEFFRKERADEIPEYQKERREIKIPEVSPYRKRTVQVKHEPENGKIYPGQPADETDENVMHLMVVHDQDAIRTELKKLVSELLQEMMGAPA